MLRILTARETLKGPPRTITVAITNLVVRYGRVGEVQALLEEQPEAPIESRK